MTNRRLQTGVGLIEVLIAVLVLGVGLLGIAALQAITLRNSSTSAERTQAAMQTYAMLDTLRSQRVAAVAGSFNTGADYQCSTSTTLGTPGTLAGWLADLRNTVSPSACGRVDCATDAGVTTCTIGVRWSELRATGGKDDQPPVETTSRI
jgi:type IV pilus assembly protein PilV